jgi:hypothetical protein
MTMAGSSATGPTRPSRCLAIRAADRTEIPRRCRPPGSGAFAPGPGRWAITSPAKPAAFLARTAKAVGLLVRDPRIPRPLRWGIALGLLPVPGPFDEAVLMLVALPLVVFYRGTLREAWERAG